MANILFTASVVRTLLNLPGAWFHRTVLFYYFTIITIRRSGLDLEILGLLYTVLEMFRTQ
jgi:hypothetical protein